MSIPTHQLVWQQIYSSFFQSLLPLLSGGIQSCSPGRSWQGIWNHLTSSVASSLTLSLSLWTSDVMTSPHSICRLPFSLPKTGSLLVFVLALLSFQCDCHFLREIVLYPTKWTVSFSDGFWSTPCFSFSTLITVYNEISSIDKNISFLLDRNFLGNWKSWLIFHYWIAGIWHSSEHLSSVQFSSVAQSCLTLCDPMNCSTPGLPVHHHFPEFTQTHVHWVSDAIQPSHPLLSPSPPALNFSQHQDLFKWVSSSHQMAKVLEFQLQHQSFQWTPRTDLL